MVPISILLTPQAISPQYENMTSSTKPKVYYTVSQKKQDTKLLAITSLLSDFQNFFTSRLGSKFAINSCLNIPPRVKHVATLPDEIQMQKNGIILKYVLQLMMNHKVV